MLRIADRLALGSVMDALVARRPVFHSEADFQFAFAQCIASVDASIECRLELPMVNEASGRTGYLDLLCRGPHGETPIEFKYFTRGWNGVVDGEDFRLRHHAAADLVRLGFINDIVRLETYATSLPGLAILLSNDPGLWREPGRLTRDTDFRLHDGHRIEGQLLWAGGAYAPNTRRLRGAYELGWTNYSSLDERPGGAFRYLAVAVPPAIESVSS